MGGGGLKHFKTEDWKFPQIESLLLVKIVRTYLPLKYKYNKPSICFFIFYTTFLIFTDSNILIEAISREKDR